MTSAANIHDVMQANAQCMSLLVANILRVRLRSPQCLSRMSRMSHPASDTVRFYACPKHFTGHDHFSSGMTFTTGFFWLGILAPAAWGEIMTFGLHAIRTRSRRCLTPHRPRFWLCHPACAPVPVKPPHHSARPDRGSSD